MEKGIIKKAMLSYVKKVAVHNAGMASLKGLFEPKVPKKLTKNKVN